MEIGNDAWTIIGVFGILFMMLLMFTLILRGNVRPRRRSVDTHQSVRYREGPRESRRRAVEKTRSMRGDTSREDRFVNDLEDVEDYSPRVTYKRPFRQTNPFDDNGPLERLFGSPKRTSFKKHFTDTSDLNKIFGVPRKRDD